MPDTVLEVFFFTTVKRPVYVGAVSVISDPEVEVSVVVVSSAVTTAAVMANDMHMTADNNTGTILKCFMIVLPKNTTPSYALYNSSAIFIRIYEFYL
jgi:hypothetical protein